MCPVAPLKKRTSNKNARLRPYFPGVPLKHKYLLRPYCLLQKITLNKNSKAAAVPGGRLPFKPAPTGIR